MRPADSEFLHSGLESGWFQADNGGGAALSTDTPARALQNGAQVLGFNVVQATAAIRSSFQFRDVRPEDGASADNQVSLNHVA